jgi:hypothetical protein
MEWSSSQRVDCVANNYEKMSVKGVLIGGIVDVAASILLSVPVALYAIEKVDPSRISKGQIEPTVTTAIHGNITSVHGPVTDRLGLLGSGWLLAARLAKHDELGHLPSGEFSLGRS